MCNWKPLLFDASPPIIFVVVTSFLFDVGVGSSMVDVIFPNSLVLIIYRLLGVLFPKIIYPPSVVCSALAWLKSY